MGRPADCSVGPTSNVNAQGFGEIYPAPQFGFFFFEWFAWWVWDVWCFIEDSSVKLEFFSIRSFVGVVKIWTFIADINGGLEKIPILHLNPQWNAKYLRPTKQIIKKKNQNFFQKTLIKSDPP